MTSAVSQALEAAAAVLESDIEACADCDWGHGATGKDSDGEPMALP